MMGKGGSCSRFLLRIGLAFALSACAIDISGLSDQSGAINTPPLTVPETRSFQLKQNSSVQFELSPNETGTGTQTLIILDPPSRGTLKIEGEEVLYRTQDATEVGEDRFSYQIVRDGRVSNQGWVELEIQPLTPGSYSYLESYTGGNFALEGWQTRQSSYGHRLPPIGDFGTGTYNALPSPYRELGVYVQSGAYSGDDVYNQLFGRLPVDGSGGPMNDWPWIADSLHIPECAFEVEITAKLTYRSGNPLVGFLLNYRFDDEGLMSGYLVLVNSGANGMILHKFSGVDEHAISFLDRWPGHPAEGMQNPVDYGVGKAWDRRVGTFPSGGVVAPNQTDVFVAFRYRYDPNTSQTTIGYESRQDSGHDLIAGGYDVERILTGVDSLAPGGDFGIMPLSYHTGSGLSFDSVLRINEFNLQCSVP